MVEAISNRPSAFKGIVATSVLAGVLNAGVQAGYELYDVKTAPKKYRQVADEYLKEAIAAEQAGKKSLSQHFFNKAEAVEQAIKTRKFSWKNVGRGALWGAALTFALCTVLHGFGALMGRK